jgi:hypothetical protein
VSFPVFTFYCDPELDGQVERELAFDSRFRVRHIDDQAVDPAARSTLAGVIVAALLPTDLR